METSGRGGWGPDEVDTTAYLLSSSSVGVLHGLVCWYEVGGDRRAGEGGSDPNNTVSTGSALSSPIFGGIDRLAILVSSF